MGTTTSIPEKFIYIKNQCRLVDIDGNDIGSAANVSNSFKLRLFIGPFQKTVP